MSEQKEETAKNPGLPWLHGSDGIHCVDLAVNVAHWTSLVGKRWADWVSNALFSLTDSAKAVEK